jgi:hypothetical protein
VGVSGQVDHPGDRSLGVSDPGWSPDVFVDAQDLHPDQSGRVAQPPGRLSLDRVPAGVPVDTEVSSQRRHGGVVDGQRIRRPTRRAGGQLRPRRDQVVLFGEHLDRAVRFAAAPQSGQPHQPDRYPEARSVRDDPSTPAVADRDDAALRAAADVSVGLDGQHHPLRLSFDGQDMHPGHVEQQVGTRAPERARGARRVIHVEVFNRSVSLVASDPEGLDIFIPAPPRPTHSEHGNPAQIRRAPITPHPFPSSGVALTP